MIYKTFMMGKNKKQLLIVINAIKKIGHCDRGKECVCVGYYFSEDRRREDI